MIREPPCPAPHSPSLLAPTLTLTPARSIPTAIDAIRNISTTTDTFNLTASEDQHLFTDAGLAPFGVIAFLSNSDQVLSATGEQALQRWLEKGGGLVGLHAATACLFNDTAFGVAMGSW